MTVQHHSHRLARTVVAGLAAAALAAPAAVARPIDNTWPPASGDAGTTVAVEPDPAAAGAPVVRTIDAGFDWGSAAIGAGSAGALVVIVGLGGLTYTGRRRIGVAR
jgi:hypothetical protein